MPPTTTSSAPAPLKLFSADEVSQHRTSDSLWTVINSDVYDLTRFLSMHPGGEGVLLASSIAGGDSTEAFFALHRSEVLARYSRYKIGRLQDPKKEEWKVPVEGELSEVPYAEPPWVLEGLYKTPYYKDSHRRLQKSMRFFFDTYVKVGPPSFLPSLSLPRR